ncbi:MAG TPA: DUF4390 domain-containing protein [Caldimonas sp.]|nr:DUF4390 domain-containing protein [Caldimonas sp.]
MQRGPDHQQPGHGAGEGGVDPHRRTALAAAVTAVLVGAVPPLAAAPEHMQLTALDLTRDEDGVYLTYAVEFDLPHAVEDALNRSVPLYFVAEAQVYRDRWYWRDRRVAEAVRVWRIVYQPLTGGYRVTFGALSQTYTSRSEALSSITRALRWKIAEPGQLEEGSHHYLEFRYRLDTNLLPRPMQIGIAGQPDWQLSLMRTLRID